MVIIAKFGNDASPGRQVFLKFLLNLEKPLEFQYLGNSWNRETNEKFGNAFCRSKQVFMEFLLNLATSPEFLDWLYF